MTLWCLSITIFLLSSAQEQAGQQTSWPMHILTAGKKFTNDFFNWYYLFCACYHSLVEKQIFFWKMCNFYLGQIFTIADKTYLLYFVHYFICNLCKINSYILFFKEQYFFISDICIDINWNWLCWPWFFFLKNRNVVLIFYISLKCIQKYCLTQNVSFNQT